MSVRGSTLADMAPGTNSPDPDTSVPATPSSTNQMTASDVYHTDTATDSGEDGRDPLQPEVGHLLRDSLTEEEVNQGADLDSELDPKNLEILSLSTRALDKAEALARRVWEAGWTVVHHNSLPKWLRDNDFLVKGHRPPLNSFYACFKSIFRIHTETGNIWTHLLGFIAFIGIATYFLTRPSMEIQWQDKAVFSAFFVGAILCMGFSFIFHTVYCHSENVGRFFNNNSKQLWYLRTDEDV